MATDPDSKKRKKSGSKSTLSNLKTLGHELLSSRAHVNNPPFLLNYISPSSKPSHTLEALLSLQSFFSPLFPDLPNYSKNDKNVKAMDNTDPEIIFRTWVKAKSDEFLGSLINVYVSSESDDNIRDIVLDTIMEFIKLGSDGRFNSSLYHKLLHTVVHSELQIEVLLESLSSKYFKYIDVRYFTYISLEKIVRTHEADINNGTHDQDEKHTLSRRELSVLKIHHILLQIPPLEGLDEKSDYDIWSGSGLSEEESNVHAKAKHTNQSGEKKNNALSVEKNCEKDEVKLY